MDKKRFCRSCGKVLVRRERRTCSNVCSLSAYKSDREFERFFK